MEQGKDKGAEEVFAELFAQWDIEQWLVNIGLLFSLKQSKELRMFIYG